MQIQNQSKRKRFKTHAFCILPEHQAALVELALRWDCSISEVLRNVLDESLLIMEVWADVDDEK